MILDSVGVPELCRGAGIVIASVESRIREIESERKICVGLRILQNDIRSETRP